MLSHKRNTSIAPLPGLRSERLAMDLSQDELARLAGVSRKTIERAEAGRPVLGRTRRRLETALAHAIEAREPAA